MSVPVQFERQTSDEGLAERADPGRWFSAANPWEIRTRTRARSGDRSLGYPSSIDGKSRRDLIARGLGAPMLIVAHGAPGLIKAVEQCWPSSDRQHCAVHRVRNLLAKLPERERERVRARRVRKLDSGLDWGSEATPVRR
jgi:hypothetical protein